MCCKDFMKYFLGIDPGASGAIAVLDEEGHLVKVIDMPVFEVLVGKAVKRRVSPELLAGEIEPYVRSDSMAWLEQVSARPGQGVSSMFAFGESFGIIKGVLGALRVPTQMVTPNAWKKAMNLNASKDGSRAKATQMWPAQASMFKRVKDDGRAESCLIAEFGRNKVSW